ncbi:hypothetical protein F8M41_010373 [Gigaspora margarita]|uniref:Uncharacterized protein n=1 Tax=Gigaspora margarita TaxID=4874 RepID=A0A8H4A1B6_GIGMA|nr:hypothetical protein F8M41_010373 [Gigaspora margarita]
MSFVKNFVNKLNKQNTFTSKETYVETWKEESKFNNKEDSDVSTLLLTKEENPIVCDKFETSEYKIFISYDKFKEYLLDENIINVGATYRSKEK